MEAESGVTRSMNDEIHSSDIQEDQMEVESGITRSIIFSTSFFGYPSKSNGR